MSIPPQNGSTLKMSLISTLTITCERCTQNGTSRSPTEAYSEGGRIHLTGLVHGAVTTSKRKTPTRGEVQMFKLQVCKVVGVKYVESETVLTFEFVDRRFQRGRIVLTTHQQFGFPVDRGGATLSLIPVYQLTEAEASEFNTFYRQVKVGQTIFAHVIEVERDLLIFRWTPDTVWALRKKEVQDKKIKASSQNPVMVGRLKSQQKAG